MDFYAHTPGGNGEWQLLTDHLQSVAKMAGQFAADFSNADVAYLIGLWHDLGKFSDAFQNYLLASEAGQRAKGPDHKAAGALLAAEQLGPLAFAIQGHHGGLESLAWLKAWLAAAERRPEVLEARRRGQTALAGALAGRAPALPALVEQDRLAGELLVRMLFSALVDADFLDTERHFSAERADQRQRSPSMAELWQRFEDYQTSRTGNRRDRVGLARHQIYEACLAAAEQPPGIFRLTVPTGGGKTRSVMGFALRHALKHGLRRVVVAVPFISITEQTADVYREIFETGQGNLPAVLEHHSGVEGPDDPDAAWSRLAAENWDAPIVVTTTVQLCESLFSNRPSRARKLHRLAGSVIILDEAQALPAHLLSPILDVLRCLCRDYGATVVISTATQPAFQTIPVFAGVPASEIVPRPERFFAELRRVDFDWRLHSPVTWTEAAGWLREEQQALAVVNTRKDALALLEALDDPLALHLSTLLCGAHRREVLRTVRERLDRGQPCRLVSTQVVEAGVDLDFPLVLRAAGPLDAIIQAAGRCNREGKRAIGRVIVFEPAEGGLPPGAYKTGAGIARTLLSADRRDPNDPMAGTLYFQRLFERVDTDARGIQRLRERLDFPEVAREFKMIEPGESVVVSYGSADEVARLAADLEGVRSQRGNRRLLLRRLQPYLVTMPHWQAEEARRKGLLLEVTPGLGEWFGGYDPVRGVTWDGDSPLVI